MSRYRHGGGRAGNLAPEALTTLRSAIPGVASVSNPHTALGGVDPQAVSAAQEDSAYEIRTRYRAVTAEDYEFLAVESSPRVARALRVMTNDPGVTIRILPNVDPADRRLSFEELNPDERLYETVYYYLDQRKLVGCPLHLLPVRLRGVSVVVNLQVAPRVDMNRVEREVRRSLFTYLNPLIGGTAGAVGTGWPFGRSLNQGELYAIVNATEGIDFVKFLRLYEYNIATSEQAPKAAGRQIAIEPDEVIASGEHIVRVARRPG
jgi:predicted phage baseplate assembly protein